MDSRGDERSPTDQLERVVLQCRVKSGLPQEVLVFKEVATSPLASDPRCQHDLGQGRCAVCQPNSAAVSASCCELGCKLASG